MTNQVCVWVLLVVVIDDKEDLFKKFERWVGGLLKDCLCITSVVNNSNAFR